MTEGKKTLENSSRLIVVILIVIICLSLLNILLVFFKGDAYPLNEKGLIGDAVGGLTSPFINSITGLLVYLSFREQTRANRIQVEEIKKQEERLVKQETQNEQLSNFNTITDLIKDSGSVLNEITYKIVLQTYPDEDAINPFPNTGSYALNNFVEILSRNKMLSYYLDNPEATLNRFINLYRTLTFILIQIRSLPTDNMYRSILIIKYENMVLDSRVHLTTICTKMASYQCSENIQTEKLESLSSLTLQYGKLVNDLGIKAY